MVEPMNNVAPELSPGSKSAGKMQEELVQLLAVRKGHFKLESGHHGDLWLDLELLCVRPELLRPFVAELARLLSKHNIDAVCGPLVEGAFVALMVALEMKVDFFYASPCANPKSDGLYPVNYRLPDPVRSRVRHKRVAIVNDVINAGSAVRGTLADLEACEAQPVSIGALLVLGTSISSFTVGKRIALENVAFLANAFWEPATCPLCATGIPLENE